MSEPTEAEHIDDAAGPGIRLRQARERAGLGCEEVAEQLNLTDMQIAMLEAENYAGLAGPTFVQGYLRSYARLLGLDAAPLLEAYHSQRLAVSPTRASRRRPSLDHGSFQRYLGLAALALVLVCLWAWQRWSQQVEQPAAALRVAPAPLLTESPEEILPAPVALGLEVIAEPVGQLMAEADEMEAELDGEPSRPESAVGAVEAPQQSLAEPVEPVDDRLTLRY